MSKVYIITAFDLVTAIERIVKVYSEKNKEKAKNGVDRLNAQVEDEELEYRLTSWEVDGYPIKNVEYARLIHEVERWYKGKIKIIYGIAGSAEV